MNEQNLDINAVAVKLGSQREMINAKREQREKAVKAFKDKVTTVPRLIDEKMQERIQADRQKLENTGIGNLMESCIRKELVDKHAHVNKKILIGKTKPAIRLSFGEYETFDGHYERRVTAYMKGDELVIRGKKRYTVSDKLSINEALALAIANPRKTFLY